MTRTYEYEGFRLEVRVEPDSCFGTNRLSLVGTGYIAIIRIFQADNAIAVFSPLRFGEAGGRSFGTEDAALAGGSDAAHRIVDDLFREDRC
ncbi:hypothetical protein [Paraburkholderia sp. Ac-20347]|uniref:hypothetical protein n=1 Tax=Paraburkholderia sp. Ac-20347 TaxID=2703892 RepID=UPI00197D7270|nr:hypothetical protein [Paraburkholderia sp. Ac-20347]MBN3809878.1 hypothetical protein [Paraburkholderia sp. Ac-20347]